jgi:hypothetical protein
LRERLIEIKGFMYAVLLILGVLVARSCHG